MGIGLPADRATLAEQVLTGTPLCSAELALLFLWASVPLLVLTCFSRGADGGGGGGW